MKNILFKLLFVLSAAVVMCSCQKQGADLFAGSYTYKISGVIGLVPTWKIESGIESDTTYVSLATEQGQLNISKNGSNDKVILTWNDILGEAGSVTASADGSSLKLDQGKKTVLAGAGLRSYTGAVSYTGNGSIYDNMIVMSLTYQGELSGTVSMTIVSSNIECVAKAN